MDYGYTAGGADYASHTIDEGRGSIFLKFKIRFLVNGIFFVCSLSISNANLSGKKVLSKNIGTAGYDYVLILYDQKVLTHVM